MVQIGELRILSMLARGTWWAVFLVSLLCFIYGQWEGFFWYQLPSSASTTYSMGTQLSANDLSILVNWGITPVVYSGCRVILSLIQTFGYMAMGFVLYHRKRSSGAFEYLTSLIFVSLGTMLSTPEFLNHSSPGLLHELLSIVNYFGNLYLIVFFMFPNGRFVPTWTRFVAAFLVVTQAGSIFFKDTIIDPFTWPYGLNLWGWVALHVVAFISQWRRYRSSTDSEKRLGKWLIFSITGFMVAALWMAVFGQSDNLAIKLGTLLVTSFAPLTLPISITIGILRYRLWGIELFVNRTIVYLSLSFCIIASYVTLIGLLSVFFQSTSNFAISLLATGLVAFLTQPLRYKLQRMANHLVYGNKKDPYTVFSQLGQRLDAMLSTQSILPFVTETLAQTLKFPYVAIHINEQQQEDKRSIIAYGEPMRGERVIPIMYLGEHVGSLIIGLGPSSPAVTPTEMRFLTDIARQLGFVAKAQSLTDELQHSREQLVLAREEERRRLRRDLHDGLGTALASLSLNLEAARQYVHEEPSTADFLLKKTHSQLQSAMADIRRLVYALRPPSLDEFGLLFAIEEQARQYEDVMDVIIECSEELPILPAAVEVAIYRIVQEGLTNIVRHASASSCRIRIWLDRNAHVEITDDGKGMNRDQRKGIGLSSMEERAKELGGECTVQAEANGGTRVYLKLPLREGA